MTEVLEYHFSRVCEIRYFMLINGAVRSQEIKDLNSLKIITPSFEKHAKKIKPGMPPERYSQVANKAPITKT